MMNRAETIQKMASTICDVVGESYKKNASIYRLPLRVCLLFFFFLGIIGPFLRVTLRLRLRVVLRLLPPTEVSSFGFQIELY
tara:strand:+ start:2484 stop:2729 length:246 start_codon:yes stop_codon:yes gene_type:complete